MSRLESMAEETRQPGLLLIQQFLRTGLFPGQNLAAGLQLVGAVAIKELVYVLPKSEQTLGILQCILR